MIEWTVVGSNPKKIPVRRVRRMRGCEGREDERVRRVKRMRGCEVREDG